MSNFNPVPFMNSLASIWSVSYTPKNSLSSKNKEIQLEYFKGTQRNRPAKGTWTQNLPELRRGLNHWAKAIVWTRHLPWWTSPTTCDVIGGGGSTEPWLAYLHSDPTDPGSYHSSSCWENRQLCLEQWTVALKCWSKPSSSGKWHVKTTKKLWRHLTESAYLQNPYIDIGPSHFCQFPLRHQNFL